MQSMHAFEAYARRVYQHNANRLELVAISCTQSNSANLRLFSMRSRNWIIITNTYAWGCACATYAAFILLVEQTPLSWCSLAYSLKRESKKCVNPDIRTESHWIRVKILVKVLERSKLLLYSLYSVDSCYILMYISVLYVLNIPLHS